MKKLLHKKKFVFCSFFFRKAKKSGHKKMCIRWKNLLIFFFVKLISKNFLKDERKKKTQKNNDTHKNIFEKF